MTVSADTAARRAAFKDFQLPPSGRERAESFASVLRAKKVTKGELEYFQLSGDASVVDQPYQMWDMFGPYTETIRSGAFDKTLRDNPDVAFLVNHRGMTMARTTNGTLELTTNPNLHAEAWLNPKRSDVKDLVLAVEEGNIDQMSFAFRITQGQWSPDWTEYYIDEVDLDRGDVSAVNYGANPYTSISARARDLFETIEHLEGPALRAAHERLSARLAELDNQSGGGGLSRILLEAKLEAGLL